MATPAFADGAMWTGGDHAVAAIVVLLGLALVSVTLVLGLLMVVVAVVRRLGFQSRELDTVPLARVVKRAAAP